MIPKRPTFTILVAALILAISHTAFSAEPVAIRQFSVFPQSVALSPDGKVLAACDDFTLKLFNVSDGKELKTISTTQRSSRLAFSPDGNFLVGSMGSLIDVRKAETLEVVGKQTRLAEGSTGGWGFSADGKHIIGGAGYTFTTLDLATLKPIAGTFPKPLGSLTAVAVSNDGKLLAYAMQSNPTSPTIGNQVELWNLETGKPFKTVKLPDSIVQLAFTGNNKNLAATMTQNGVALITLPGGTLAGVLKTDRTYYVTASNTDLIAIHYVVGEKPPQPFFTAIYRLPARQLLGTIPENESATEAAAFSSDGQYITVMRSNLGLYKITELQAH